VDLWLAPHNDDETLFGAFSLIRHRPHVHICFRSQVQEDRYGVLAETRELETAQALWWLGSIEWSQGLTLDSLPDASGALLDDFNRLDASYTPERVWAPAYEDGGHAQHNLVAFVANAVWGVKVTPYLTYVHGSMRTRGVGVEYEPSWVWSKLKALTCYRSQIELDSTRAWFMDDTLREYVP
jgi:LmbE family N-acetylglucosaminyl deacetylase